MLISSTLRIILKISTLVWLWLIQVFLSIVEIKSIAEIIIESLDYPENVSTEIF